MSIDLKKERPELYRAPTTDFSEVDVPEMRYLAVDGHGDPNVSVEYADAVRSLYAVAYAVRAAFKGRTGDTFVVPPLEGLWSSADPAAFVAREKASWDWTMLIPLPDQVTAPDIDAGFSTATAKHDLPIGRLRTQRLREGRCLQILHIGPYDAEGPTLARLHHEVMPARGVTWNGPHHEIYLGDPRRSAPATLRTILRQPVRPMAP